jgi:uncharacterized protein (DUF1800 family)
MQTNDVEECEAPEQTANDNVKTDSSDMKSGAALALASLSLAACGGGGAAGGGGGFVSSAASSSLSSSSLASSSITSSASSKSSALSSSSSSVSSSSSLSSSVPSSSSSSSSSSAAAITSNEAVSFLAQASLSSTEAEVARVKSLGYSGWLDDEMKKPLGTKNVDILATKGLGDIANKNNTTGADNMMWRRLIASNDPLRQRVALALSEIIVIGLGISGISFRQFALAYYWDILEANAFGKYRDLLEQMSKSPAMGAWLTFRGNRKASGNSLPDENYAREIMQLFSIGVYDLNLDGSLKLTAGKPKETYTQDDVSQLARVFTGWDLDTSVGTTDTHDRVVRPMIQTAKYHELGTKAFLGTTIPANTAGEASLQTALDTLMAHANIAPFISRQLIQRLVTSDPSSTYISRVASVFNDNGKGVKGDLAAVIKAILLDTEARSATRLSNVSFGKLREPMLRFVHWARNFGYTDPADNWAIGDTSDPATRLGQSPLRSSSVFNFFRPGYIPPSAFIGQRTAPEFQITTETQVAGYINFMQGVISNGIASIKADYSKLMPLATDSSKLLAELNTSLAGGQLSSTTIANFKTALDSIAATTTTGQNNRIYAAILLVMACPEYLAQK